MRKSIWTVLLVAAVTLLAAGCAKEQDLKSLQEKVDGLDTRVTALEQAVKKINDETVPGLQNLVKAIEKKLTVVNVVEGDGEYTILFSDGTSATIKDGAKGEQGEQGEQGVQGEQGEQGEKGDMPEISITLGEGGIYYWTVNGELLKDNDGNPVPVTTPGPQGPQGEQGEQGEQGAAGTDGKDGVTPLFGTNNEGKLQVSYDGGTTWTVITLNTIDGSQFTAAYIDEELSTEDYIVLVVGETKVEIPKEKTFALNILYQGEISSVGANAGDNISLEYAVQGASEGDDITVDVLSATAGISAKIVKTDALTGYIFIGVPEDEEGAEHVAITGKVFVFADNNKGKTNIKVISLEEGIIEAVADVDAQIPAAGGEVNLTVTTNKAYNVMISDGAESWLSVTETKATHTDELTIVAEPNTTGAYRVGTVSVTDEASGETIKDFTIIQQPASDVATDLASIRSLADGTAVAGQKAIVLAASKEGALVVDENGAYLYLAKEDNEAVRGDEVSFAGTRKTTEDTKVKYVEASSITVTASQQEVTDLPFTWMGYAGSANSVNTVVTGTLTKGADGVYYVVTTRDYGPLKVETVFDEAALAALEGKLVNVTGYTNGYLDKYDEDKNFIGYTGFILGSIEELVFTENPAWTLSFVGENGTRDQFTLVATSEDWYARYGGKVYKKSVLETAGSVEKFLEGEATSVADLIQNYLWYYSKPISEYAYNTSKDLSFTRAAKYGEFFTVIIGLQENGLPSGKYAICQYEKESPYYQLAYTDYLGKWNFAGSVITIEEDVKDVSYNITGLPTQYDGTVVKATYDSKYGIVSVSEQLLGVDESNISYYLSGLFDSGGYYFSYPTANSSGPDVLFTVGKLKETDEYGVVTGINSKYGFDMQCYTFAQFSGSTRKSYTGIQTTPSKITPYVPPVHADYGDFLGQWIVSTTGGASTWNIEKKDDGKSYNITGINGLAENGAGDPMVVEGIYTDEGTLTLSVQIVSDTYTFNNQSGIFDYLSALNGQYVTKTVGTVLATCTVEDGLLHIAPGYFSGADVTTLLFLRSSMSLLSSVQTPLPAVADRPQEGSEAYLKWIGSWSTQRNVREYNEETKEYGDPEVVTDTWRIVEDITNKSYVIYGYEGIPDNYGMAIKATFDEESSKIVLNPQVMGNWTNNGVTYTDCLVAKTSGGLSLDNNLSAVLSDNGDGTATLSSTDLLSLQYYYLDEEYKAYSYSSDAYELPLTLTKVDAGGSSYSISTASKSAFVRKNSVGEVKSVNIKDVKVLEENSIQVSLNLYYSPNESSDYLKK